MLILLESIQYLIISILNLFFKENMVIEYITYISLALGLIPIIIKIIKRGLRSLRVMYNITSTNIILVLANMLLYVLYYFGLQVSIYILIVINVIKVAIDVIKAITGREILV